MRVLIIGSGYIAVRLAKKLASLYYDVIIFSRKKPVFIEFNFTHFIGDMRDYAQISKVILQTRPEVVFHLAADKNRTRDKNIIQNQLQTNLLSTENILNACEKLDNLRSLIVIGTADEYGNIQAPYNENDKEMPVSPYGLSKLCQTTLCQTYYRMSQLPVTVLRPTLVYGPGQPLDMFLPSMISALLQNKPFLMTPGEQLRNFIYIDDMIDALICAALNSKEKGEVINIGSQESIMIKELAQMIASLLKKESLLKVGALDYRENECFDYSVDIAKSFKLLHWVPKVSIQVGLHATIAYYKDVYSEKKSPLLF